MDETGGPSDASRAFGRQTWRTERPSSVAASLVVTSPTSSSVRIRARSCSRVDIVIPPPSLGHAGERLHEWMFATRWWREMVGEPQGQPRRRRHVVPIVLGRGVRLWDGLEGLERDYAIEAVSSPAGVTHLSFTRREGPGAG